MQCVYDSQGAFLILPLSLIQSVMTLSFTIFDNPVFYDPVSDDPVLNDPAVCAPVFHGRALGLECFRGTTRLEWRRP